MVLMKAPGSSFRLAQVAQVAGELASEDQSARVVLAHDPAAAVQGVFIQVAGGLQLAQVAQVAGKLASPSFR